MEYTDRETRPGDYASNGLRDGLLTPGRELQGSARGCRLVDASEHSETVFTCYRTSLS